MRIIPQQYDDIQYWAVERWLGRGLLHGFLGRDLDLKQDDKNWRTTFKRIFPSAGGLYLLRQNHGNDIVEINWREGRICSEKSSSVGRPSGDAWIIAGNKVESGQGRVGGYSACFGIQTADCFPVLVVSPELGSVAAVHCGWRGSLNGILEIVLQRFLEAGANPKLLEVAIGPGANGCCYEIGEDVSQLFKQSQLGEAGKVLEVRGLRTYAHLKNLLIEQFIQKGCLRSNIAIHGECTICGDNFFSHRREKSLAGRQLSFIAGDFVE